MGTRFEFVLRGADAAALRAAGEEALEEIHATEDEWSRFRNDSWLALIQREAPERSVRLPAHMFEMLELCARVWSSSDGAFDPTVGDQMDSHGFHPARAKAADRPGSVGTATFAAVALDAPTRSIRLLAPVSLDFGAVAKGAGLDRAAEVLRESGVTSALLHGGTSTVVALGRDRGRPWRVGVETPAGVQPVHVELDDAALSVSAPHGRVAPDGATHVLDPRDGAAVTMGLTAVVDTFAASADAWSTALLVMAGRAQDPDRDWTSVCAPVRAQLLVGGTTEPSRRTCAGDESSRFVFSPATMDCST